MRLARLACGLMCALALGSTIASAGTSADVSAARRHACPAETNATNIRTAGLSCSMAATALMTYEGAPIGCETGSRCVQSVLGKRLPGSSWNFGDDPHGLTVTR